MLPTSKRYTFLVLTNFSVDILVRIPVPGLNWYQVLFNHLVTASARSRSERLTERVEFITICGVVKGDIVACQSSFQDYHFAGSYEPAVRSLFTQRNKSNQVEIINVEWGE